MNTENIIFDYHYEKLNQHHDLSKFSCGVEDLDEFLKEDALKQQEQNLNVTYLAIHESEIIGYVSILADKIECKQIDNTIESKYKNYPAIKIGRLAVNEKYKGLGIGNEILASICELIKEISEEIGVSFITVDAYFNARAFYQKTHLLKKESTILKAKEKSTKRPNNIHIYV